MSGIIIYGDPRSLADLALTPFLAYIDKVPEGPEMLASRAHIRRWLKTMTARPSFIETIYQAPNAEAAE